MPQRSHSKSGHKLTWKGYCHLLEKKIKERDMQDICKRLRYMFVPAGKNVINYGEFGDQFYIILDGTVSINIPMPASSSQQQTNQPGVLMRRMTQLFEPIVIQKGSVRDSDSGAFGTGHNLRKSETTDLGSSKAVNNRKKTFFPVQMEHHQQEQKSKRQSIKVNTKMSFQQEPSATAKHEENATVMREVATLGEGKSFVDTHFATLDKHDYEISLAKIERKHMQKMIDFLMQIPCFKGWTQNSVLKFSYYLKKQKFKRNQTLYSYGEQAKSVFIIKKGEIELIKKVKREGSDSKHRLYQKAFGSKDSDRRKSPSLENRGGSRLSRAERTKQLIDSIPAVSNIIIVGPGSMIGEEDAISECQEQTCTAKCVSNEATVYSISVDDFLTLKNSGTAWLNILQKSLWKEQLKIACPAAQRLSQERQKSEERQNVNAYYDISKSQFNKLHYHLEDMVGKQRDFQYKDRNGCYRTNNSHIDLLKKQKRRNLSMINKTEGYQLPVIDAQVVSRNLKDDPSLFKSSCYPRKLGYAQPQQFTINGKSTQIIESKLKSQRYAPVAISSVGVQASKDQERQNLTMMLAAQASYREDSYSLLLSKSFDKPVIKSVKQYNRDLSGSVNDNLAEGPSKIRVIDLLRMQGSGFAYRSGKSRHTRMKSMESDSALGGNNTQYLRLAKLD